MGERPKPPDLERTEREVLALLVITDPDGLAVGELSDLLHNHSAPCEAADRLVELGLAVRLHESIAHWMATSAGLGVAKRC